MDVLFSDTLTLRLQSKILSQMTAKIPLFLVSFKGLSFRYFGTRLAV